MKTDSPYDRGDIHINKNDKVLEIGPGHNPTYRSNVIAEKFIDTNYHRCGDVKIYPHQTFVHADVWGIERSGFFNGREKWAKGFENQRV